MADWLSGWSGKRVKITVDSGDIDSDQTWFPVHVYLSASSGINGDDVTAVFDELGSDANRKKIAVTKSDGTTELYVEIDKWDDANEKAWLWVSRDGWTVASGSDTDFYLYYDSTHADNDTYVGDPNSTPAEKVWDGNFKLVTHMRDDPDTSHVRDSTSNDNDGTKKGAAEPAVTTSGKIDDAQQFDGSDDDVDLGTSATLRPNSGITIEAWVNITQDTNIVVNQDRVWLTKKGYNFFVWTDDNFYFDLGPFPAAYHRIANSFASYYGALTHIVGTWDGIIQKAYINGQVQADTESWSGSIVYSALAVEIGKDKEPTPNYLAGIIDEVRISSVGRSSAWVKACYETQRDHLLSYGSEEEYTPPAVTHGYRVRPRRPLAIKPTPRDFFISHMNDWPVLLQYFMLKRRGKINKELQKIIVSD